MKRNVRRILSLALVLIMLCGAMAPAAFAATDAYGIFWTTNECSYFPDKVHRPYSSSSGGDLGLVAYICPCGVMGLGSIFSSGTGTGNITGHTHVYSPINASQHQLICNTLGTSCPYHGMLSSHSYSSTGYCTECDYYYGTSGYGHDHQYTQAGETYHYVTCSNYSCTYYNGVCETHTGNPCYYCGYNGSGTNTGNFQWSSNYCYGNSTDHTHYPVYDATNGYYCWYCNAKPLNYGGATTGNLTWSNPYCAYNTTGGYTHYAVYDPTYGYYCYYCHTAPITSGTGSDYAYGTAGRIYVYASDSMTDDTYTLNESVSLTVSAASTDATSYTYTYEWSGDVYAYDTTSGYAYLDTSGSTAYASCTVTAYSGSTAVDSATVYWYATALAGDGIIYSAVKGENVVLDEEDFEDFWAEQYPNGTLNYVRFTGVSSGNLYDNYAGGTTLRTDVRARGSSCYLDPGTNQIGLDDLTYVPTAYGNAGAVTIQFTAYGSSSYNYGYNYGYSYGSTSLSGTVTILYTAKEVTPNVYDITGSSVALDADDFLAKYKEVMDVTYAGSLSIQFLEAPVYGTLTLGYGSNYWYQSTGTKLTDANIGSYSFSTSATGTYSLNNLTYTPGAAADTIRFACYSGSQLKFVGTVNFGSSERYTVEMTTTVGEAVTFSNSDFNAADSTGLLTSGYLYLGTPSAGTLYKNYANGTGTRVTTSEYFSATDLNKVTYVPRAGFVGVAEIPYTAYTYLGAQIKGTIKVYVGRGFTDVLGTTSAWAAPYVNKLSAQGIVSGTDSSMTKFSPTKTVSYGEALKLIMMAAGYPEQVKTGTHWASGYLTKAYADGLVSSSNIDLDAEITRDTIATITAKALELGYASSVDRGVTAPSDSTNGYVYALYNAGIVNGVNVGGSNYWYGTRSITRAEISKIICMVADYAE